MVFTNGSVDFRNFKTAAPVGQRFYKRGEVVATAAAELPGPATSWAEKAPAGVRVPQWSEWAGEESWLIWHLCQ